MSTPSVPDMMAYLPWFRIDWGWNELSEEQRAALRPFEARIQADPQKASVEWLTGMLQQASRQVPGQTLYAAFEDGEGALFLAEAGDGRVSIQMPDDELSAVFERISESSPQELFPERLSFDDFRAAGVDKLARSYEFPRFLLDEIQENAMRTDRSPSYILRKAWSLANDRLDAVQTSGELRSELDRMSPPAVPDHEKQRFYFSLDMLEELDEKSRLLGCQPSRLLQAAWLLSRDRIAALPSSEDPARTPT